MESTVARLCRELLRDGLLCELNACNFNFVRKTKFSSAARMPGMMDKGSEYLGKGRSNGTKSPSNASNGHFSEESGSDDEHGIASNNTHIFT